MTEPITKANRALQTYREMAESWRKMAAVSGRPGPLFLRTQAYEATALALERAEKAHTTRPAERSPTKHESLGSA